MKVSETYLEGLKIPWSFAPCEFDSRPRHQVREFVSNSLNFARNFARRVILPYSYHLDLTQNCLHHFHRTTAG